MVHERLIVESFGRLRFFATRRWCLRKGVWRGSLKLAWLDCALHATVSLFGERAQGCTIESHGRYESNHIGRTWKRLLALYSLILLVSLVVMLGVKGRPRLWADATCCGLDCLEEAWLRWSINAVIACHDIQGVLVNKSETNSRTDGHVRNGHNRWRRGNKLWQATRLGTVAGGPTLIRTSPNLEMVTMRSRGGDVGEQIRSQITTPPQSTSKFKPSGSFFLMPLTCYGTFSVFTWAQSVLRSFESFP